ncbi:MAG: hypothetical protein WC648_03920 [Candidatus Paceibacterota bacterium]|jgi:hypothetical protein
MKKYLPQIIILTLIATVCAVFPTHVVDAETGGAVNAILGTFFNVTFGTALQLIGYILYTVLTIVSFGLTMSAMVLNASIYLTTHLGIFIDNTPAIYTVWRILRDISGMFLIFLLLIAAIQTILGIQKANYKQTLISIVIVGILINFSFFFTTVLIDASNVVSLQLYNSIAPDISAVECDSAAATSKNANSYFNCISSSVIGARAGGLATVITNSLNIVQWRSSKSTLLQTDDRVLGSTDIGARMILVNTAAIFVTILAALSMLAAAAAAIWRICVLIMLLAFSPLWIAGYVLPQTKAEVSNKWVKHLKANLIFLPVYLLLMYVVLTIITALDLGALGNIGSTNVSDVANMTWYAPYLQLFVGFSIIIFMINLPLVTAFNIAGSTGNIIEKIAKQATGTISGWAKKGALGGVGMAWNNTGGRLASNVGNSSTLRNFAARSVVGGLALRGVKGVATNYDRNIEEQVKTRTKFAESLGHDPHELIPYQARLKSLNLDLVSAKSRNDKVEVDKLEKTIGITKGKIAEIENRRARTYANRLETSILSRMSVSNGIAAAKIQIPILEKEITRKKEGLKEIRDDIKQLNKAIRSNPAAGGIAAGTANAAQLADLTDLYNQELAKVGSINADESTLENLKLST